MIDKVMSGFAIAFVTSGVSVRVWAIFDHRPWVSHVADLVLAVTVLLLVAVMLRAAERRIVERLEEINREWQAEKYRVAVSENGIRQVR